MFSTKTVSKGTPKISRYYLSDIWLDLYRRSSHAPPGAYLFLDTVDRALKKVGIIHVVK